MVEHERERTVLSLMATRLTVVSPSVRRGCHMERTYPPRFSSQITALPSREPDTMIDHVLDAVMQVTSSVCIRMILDRVMSSFSDKLEVKLVLRCKFHFRTV